MPSNDQANSAANQKKPYYMSRKFWQMLFAEALGTFFIVQFGTGSVMSAVFKDALVGLGQIAAVWVVAVTIAIIVTGPVSGAHLNPAITIAFALLRGFEWNLVGPYIIAQFLGAVLASALNYGTLYVGSIDHFEDVNEIDRGSSDENVSIASAKAFGEYWLEPVSTFQAFMAEAVGTAILAAVIFAVTHPKHKDSSGLPIPLTIGMTVGALISVLAPLTQGGFNPARDFGPRVVAFMAGWTGVAFHKCWLYIVAPIVGAPIGAAMIDVILYADDEDEQSEARQGAASQEDASDGA